jgi:ferredoxin
VKLRVNPIACEGHGICAELLPELIRLDEWGYPVLSDREVPRALESHALRAVSECPTLALMLERLTQNRSLTNARSRPA